jgi:hypothetical protein
MGRPALVPCHADSEEPVRRSAGGGVPGKDAVRTEILFLDIPE